MASGDAAGAIRVDGKQFACDGARFLFRGITYGTFRPGVDDSRYPDPEQVKLDFAAMRDAGFTVVRTYTLPTEEILDLAADLGLRLLVGTFYPDWRYLLGASRREQLSVARAARANIRAAGRFLAGNEHVLALSLGNEIPADVVRWVGSPFLAACIKELAEVLKEEDPDRLVTYGNYPTAEYLPLEFLDFLTFNIFLEEREDFRSYLTRLHHLAGDRPLVLGEIGSDAGKDAEGELRQSEVLDWQLETALERGVAGTCVFSWTDDWWVGDAPVSDWCFGLTRADRSPRPALEVAARWNARTVAELSFDWPSISVVVCAYNAAATLDECLRHTCSLDYPNLEILVVDDGSTDGTAATASGHPRARLIRIPHSGLAVARNDGLKAASGDLVAYLDSDAYPSQEWPYYLALGLDAPDVGGVGGPNVPPLDDPPAAHRVARAPGGPVHVLVSDDRAEHVPGCNMAFWRRLLIELGGFDPIYTAAGDDVDLAWRVLNRGWEIAFHPAALVWHRRRAGLRAYLRQQGGYGRSEALVEARHPDRFTSAGSARWRGHIYQSLAPSLRRQRIYRGPYGAAAYQSVYRDGGHALDLLHQLGVPLAVVLLTTAALGLATPTLALPALCAFVALAVLFAVDFFRARPPRHLRGRAISFRLGVALLHILQPVARRWARTRQRWARQQGTPCSAGLPSAVRHLRRGVLMFAQDRPRPELAAAIVAELRRAGIRVLPSNGWQDYDARLVGSTFVWGDLVTSSHPVGYVQMRVRRRLRWPSIVSWLAACLFSTVLEPVVTMVLLTTGMAEGARGIWRTGGLVRRVVRTAASTGGRATP